MIKNYEKVIKSADYHAQIDIASAESKAELYQRIAMLNRRVYDTSVLFEDFRLWAMGMIEACNEREKTMAAELGQLRDEVERLKEHGMTKVVE